MPRISKQERYVRVAYELHCGFERAKALADALEKELKDDKGLYSADDDTRGWDVGCAVVVVDYDTLADAVRLDPVVRMLLSRKVDFSYESSASTSYGSRGACLHVEATTSISVRE